MQISQKSPVCYLTYMYNPEINTSDLPFRGFCLLQTRNVGHVHV